MKIKITTDSTGDLSEELKKRYNIGVSPLHVILGEKVYTDGEDITPQIIFDYVKETGVLPKTSAPSPEEYAAFFERESEDYDAIVHFNISEKASSSYSNAKAAAEKFKKCKVYAVDTMSLSTGQGLLALKACDFAAAGEKPEKIVKLCEDLRDKVNTSFVPDVLDYLHKGGRCSLASLIGAKVLKLHPWISMKDGQMYAKKKYMGNLESCLKKYIKDLADEYPVYDKTRCCITHCNCDRETVEKAKEYVKENFAFNEIFETITGSVVTSHCGKNTLGVLFIAAEQ